MDRIGCVRYNSYSRNILIIFAGLFAYFGSCIIHNQLLAIKAASQITKEEKPPELISQHTEDGELAGHHMCLLGVDQV